MRSKCSPTMYSSELRQQMVDIGDAPRHRIFDRNERISRLALPQSGQRILECRARLRMHVRKAFRQAKMRIRARLALVEHGARPWRRRQIFAQPRLWIS